MLFNSLALTSVWVTFQTDRRESADAKREIPMQKRSLKNRTITNRKPAKFDHRRAADQFGRFLDRECVEFRRTNAVSGSIYFVVEFPSEFDADGDKVSSSYLRFRFADHAECYTNQLYMSCAPGDYNYGQVKAEAERLLQSVEAVIEAHPKVIGF
jgi:hypothetical protein